MAGVTLFTNSLPPATIDGLYDTIDEPVKAGRMIRYTSFALGEVQDGRAMTLIDTALNAPPAIGRSRDGGSGPTQTAGGGEIIPWPGSGFSTLRPSLDLAAYGAGSNGVFYLVPAAGRALFANAPGWTFAFAISHKPTDGYGRMLFSVHSTSAVTPTHEICAVYANHGNQRYSLAGKFRQDDTRAVNSNLAVVNDELAVYVVTGDPAAGAIILRRNGTQISQLTGLPTYADNGAAWNSIRLGGTYNNSDNRGYTDPAQGLVGELTGWNRVLSSEEIAAVEAHRMRLYGLAA